MPHQIRALVASTLALVVLLNACQREAPDPPTASLEQPSLSASENETTALESEPTSYEIPERIDLPYVQSIIRALYRIEDQALTIMLREGNVTEEAQQHLAAIYDARLLPERTRRYEDAAAAGFPNTQRTPGPSDVHVEEVLSADEGCIFLSGLSDFSAFGTSPRDREGELEYFVLLPMESGQDPLGLNPTPWVLGGAIIRADGSSPEDPCGQ